MVVSGILHCRYIIKNKIMSISRHIQNLVKFYKTFLKILSGNQIMTDGQPKSNIAPTFSKRGFNNVFSCKCIFSLTVGCSNKNEMRPQK